MSLHKDIQAQLKSGYKLEQGSKSHLWFVVTAEGEPVYHDNTPYRFTDEGGWRGSVYRRQVMKTLIDLGVIDAPQRKRRTNTSSDYRTAPKRESKTPLVIVNEILRDPHATPRERGLAREYLKLVENHDKVRTLAQKLGRRVSELNDELDSRG